MSVFEKPGKVSAFDILAAMPEPLAVVGAKGAVRFANRALVELWGSGEGLAGKPLYEFFEGGPGVFALPLATWPGRTSWVKTRLLRADGTAAEVSVSAAELPWDKGSTVVLIRDLGETAMLERELTTARDELARRVSYLEEFRDGVFQMIRDLDRSEQELEDAYSTLKSTQAQLIQSSKLSALGELAAGLAHELNQPLTVIKGLSQNLLKNAAAGANMEKLGLIVNATRRMEDIITHLRAFSRTGDTELAPVALNRVIKESFIILKELLNKNSIDVRLKLGEVPLINGSANRLEQVIINLVTNARDAMPGGGALTITTTEGAARGRRSAILTVSDTGCGMPEDVIGHVFDPFFTTKEVGQGTGLGLSISYGIVKEHGGDISVKSLPGSGTSFTITLPAAPEARH